MLLELLALRCKICHLGFLPLFCFLPLHLSPSHVCILHSPIPFLSHTYAHLHPLFTHLFHSLPRAPLPFSTPLPSSFTQTYMCLPFTHPIPSSPTFLCSVSCCSCLCCSLGAPPSHTCATSQNWQANRRELYIEVVDWTGQSCQSQ